MSAVGCADCTHPYDQHAADGGHCQHVIGEGVVELAHSYPCPCPAFRWVDPRGGGSAYGGRPEQSWPGP